MTPARYILPPSAPLAYDLALVRRPRTPAERAYVGSALATSLRVLPAFDHLAALHDLATTAESTRLALRELIGPTVAGKLYDTTQHLHDRVRDEIPRDARVSVVVAAVSSLLGDVPDAAVGPCYALDVALRAATVALGDSITDAHHRTAARLMAGLT